MNRLIAVLLLWAALVPAFGQGEGAASSQQQDLTRYVDPTIGSEGLGRVFVGPSMPYAMIKPGPDALDMPNAGWSPMPVPILGFSQVHVSGTGGGQKYGNILILPYDAKYNEHGPRVAQRLDETIQLSYYSTSLASGIRGGAMDWEELRSRSDIPTIDVEVTSAPRAAIYRLTYPADALPALKFDAGAFLGMGGMPDQRETQQLVGSQIEVVNDSVVRGYNRVRGGWNNGRAYTVYFYAVCSKPFVRVQTQKGILISQSHTQTDTHQPTSAMVYFAPSYSVGSENSGNLGLVGGASSPRPDNDGETIEVKIGISYISELKARDNLYADIPDWDFVGVHQRALDSWQDLLSRITISPTATEQQKRMFYTAMYHTMIMPVDRSGENPLWADDSPYYDDYYAIWDTYRTSTPLITLIDPQREVDIVNSLLNIYKRDGYMPDARSGNSNGRTQGGSNAEIVLADAYVKGLQGIDYNLALEAMLKDAEVPPGGIEEAEGRGGLREYLELGYIPFGIPRAGNRTVEYAFCDYAIAQVAKGLGRDDIHDRYMRQSGNWRNLWRSDYEHAGTKGFIMPRDRDGNWLDSLPQGHSKITVPKYEYTAMTFEGPWYTPWWSMFFYEAPSWEYSLSIPHDVPGLIEICGAPDEFERRLDTFFDEGFYNVNNEPSFLSPCLYHWIGKPWRSSDRIRQIIADNYSDTPMGLPGNDDSGAMSSWLAFHMMGLYPNAGHDYYLINTPLLERTDIHLPPLENSREFSKTLENSRNCESSESKTFSVIAEDLSDKNRYIQSATLNGEPYPYSTITHADILAGGTLCLKMGPKPSDWGREFSRPSTSQLPSTPAVSLPENIADDIAPDRDDVNFDKLLFVFKLHGQTRRYEASFNFLPDGSIKFTWGIKRNLKWQQGTYLMLPQAVASATRLDLSMPMDGADVTLPADYTAYIISRDALRQLKTDGEMTYNGFTYKLVGTTDDEDEDYVRVLQVYDSIEGSQMWILDDERLPLILKMSDNPLEVDWTVTFPNPIGALYF